MPMLLQRLLGAQTTSIGPSLVASRPHPNRPNENRSTRGSLAVRCKESWAASNGTAWRCNSWLFGSHSHVSCGACHKCKAAQADWLQCIAPQVYHTSPGGADLAFNIMAHVHYSCDELHCECSGCSRWQADGVGHGVDTA